MHLQNIPAARPATLVRPSATLDDFLLEVDQMRESGSYAYAIQLISRRLSEKAHGEDDTERLLLGRLADLCVQFGSYQEALMVYENLLESLEREHSVDDHECLEVWVRRAAAHNALGRTREAVQDLSWVEYHWRCRADRRSRGALPNLLMTLSTSFLLEGKLPEAEAALRKASETWASVKMNPARVNPLDRLDPYGVRFLGQMGLIRKAGGRMAEAFLDLMGAVRISSEWRGAAHPETARLAVHAVEAALGSEFDDEDVRGMLRPAAVSLESSVRFDHPDLLLAERLVRAGGGMRVLVH